MLVLYMEISMNVSTLTVLLVCVISESAHAVSYQWGWQSFQPRSKRGTENGLSVVKNWSSVCEEVCSAGYGGPGCGDHWDDVPLMVISLSTARAFQEICPFLCVNKLGEKRCSCPATVGKDGLSMERNRNSLCAQTCRSKSIRLKGCDKCRNDVEAVTDSQIIDDDNESGSDSSFSDNEENLTETTEELTTKEITTIPTTTSTTTTTTTTAQPTTSTHASTTPDWLQICATLCRNGDGGSLCNCDIPPFFK